MADKVLKQILSTETPNDQGFVVLSGGIDWERYKKNNILCHNHNWSQSIGNVVNIRREGDNWVGELLFDEKTDLSRQLKAQYEAGSLRAVSIAGDPYYVEQDNLKICTRFDIYEISLVPLPSNPDCVSNFEGKDKVMAVEFMALKEHKIEQFSAEHNELIAKYNAKMEEKKKVEVEPTVEEPKTQLSATEETKTEEPTEEPKDDKVALGTEKEPSWVGAMVEKIVSAFKSAKEDAPTDQKPAETVELDAQPAEPHTFDGKKALEKEQTKFNTKMENKKTILEFLATTEGKEKLSKANRFAANARIAGKFDENAPEYQYLREFASIAIADKGFAAFMGNIHFSLNGKYDGTTADALNRLTAFASGANSINFVQTSADLAKINWLSLFYKQLFPEDKWAERCGRVSGEDVAGVIWVNSALKPKIYFGDRAPLGINASTYDDTPVGLAMKVFAVENIVWQQANTDLLAYNDVAMGQSEVLRALTNKMHNYYLQKIAEAASVKVAMSGDAFASANMFPTNPTAAGNLKALTANDLLALQMQFINQGYTMEPAEASLVLPAVFNMQLQQDNKVTSIFNKIGGGVTPNYTEYAGFRTEARNATALYDTSSRKVTDAELYCDGKTSANGTVPSYTPPVLSGTMYDAAIGFIPQEVVIALGRTNLHMIEDPSNYGWRFSMDIRTGAGAGRKDGKGIGLIVPTKNA